MTRMTKTKTKTIDRVIADDGDLKTSPRYNTCAIKQCSAASDVASILICQTGSIAVDSI
jgi:hypothetical protein